MAEKKWMDYFRRKLSRVIKLVETLQDRYMETFYCIYLISDPGILVLKIFELCVVLHPLSASLHMRLYKIVQKNLENSIN